jgi:hypothetical protein
MLINGNEYTIEPAANLIRANLIRANLIRANLRDANLREANLREANLSGANLCGANLYGTDLSGANLRGANLRGADLSGANLCGANLYGTDLRGANLYGANLYGTDLSGANLRGAHLYGTDLSGATNIPQLFQAMSIIAGEGDIIGYKKLAYGIICKLKIPADAKRSNATGRKCRAEYAIVLEGEGVSCHDDTFEYKVGDTVRPIKPFCEDRWEECASGIHFFLTREEAEAY